MAATETLERDEAKLSNTSSWNNEPFFSRGRIIALGGVGIALTSLMLWVRGDIAREDAQVNAKKYEAAKWAAQSGITQIVGVDAEFKPPKVTLSADPKSPDACEITFDFMGESLVLVQPDAAGKPYGSVTITTGDKAQAAMADLCSS